MQQLKIAYYCQHVLGIGHFHRSLAICRAIAKNSSTTLILGGPTVNADCSNLGVVQLPGLQMDQDFNNLSPCNPNHTLKKTKELRQEQLYDYFYHVKPNIFITELYPFGRKAFRFELDPILSAIANGSLAPCKVYSSVRDILVEKETGREKFESRVVNTVNSFFDGVLIHSDPDIITLDQTFNRLSDITVPLEYTGFVSPKKQPSPEQKKGIREKLGIPLETKLIVASIGGGNVGAELLKNSIAAFHLMDNFPINFHLQLFCGPYFSQKTFDQLQENSSANITLQPFTDRFPEWLEVADLSISMAGYNTCMNIAEAGIPALVFPFAQNREQTLRAETLSQQLPIGILTDKDLQPANLVRKIEKQLQLTRIKHRINLNGAEESAQIIHSV